MSSFSKDRQSNLGIINAIFQQHPSQISGSTCTIQNLRIGWFFSFPLQHWVLVVPQQYSILAKHISASFSIQRPFQLFSRCCPFWSKTNRNLFGCSLSCVSKMSHLQFLQSFKFIFSNREGPFMSSFDLFQLKINPIRENNIIISPVATLPISAIAYSSAYNIFDAATKVIASITIPFTVINESQGIVETLTYVISFHFSHSLFSSRTLEKEIPFVDTKNFSFHAPILWLKYIFVFSKPWLIGSSRSFFRGQIQRSLECLTTMDSRARSLLLRNVRRSLGCKSSTYFLR